MSKKISLRQFLMRTGKFERMKDCEKAIRSGNASLGGKITTNPNFFFNPDRYPVKIGDDLIRPTEDFVLRLFYQRGTNGSLGPDGERIPGNIQFKTTKNEIALLQ